jgi:dephospho-CoA kinase
MNPPAIENGRLTGPLTTVLNVPLIVEQLTDDDFSKLLAIVLDEKLAKNSKRRRLKRSNWASSGDSSSGLD